MSVIKKPDLKIFAQDAKTGEIEAFPDVLRGWGVTLDRTAGKPPLEWFNAVGKRVDEWLMYLTQRGVAEWDASLSYPKTAIVQFGNVIYVSVKETKGEQPDKSQASWSTFDRFLGLKNYYTRTESDTRFQPKGNYQTAGYSYSKQESDGLYLPATALGTANGQVMTVNGRYPSANNLTTAFMSNNTPDLPGATGDRNKPSLEVSNGGNKSASAAMMFHREGDFATFFGLDTDNSLAIGGHSLAGKRYRIYHEGYTGDLSTQTDAQNRANQAEQNAKDWTSAQVTSLTNNINTRATQEWVDQNFARKPVGYVSQNGWVKDPTTGIITQWGRFTVDKNTRHVTFPTTFPIGCFSIQITVGAYASVTATYFNDTSSGFDVALNGSDSKFSMSWFAIGS
ncbi:hypothetical protein PT300_00165 [Enterobacteriaceae bacterium ESL0689]|nr:hypothetical protein [Enterobacteriaceae bacterium ESL0689]